MARSVPLWVTEYSRRHAVLEHKNRKRLAVVSLKANFGERSAKQFRVKADCVWRDRESLLYQYNRVFGAMRRWRDAVKFGRACGWLLFIHGDILLTSRSQTIGLKDISN